MNSKGNYPRFCEELETQLIAHLRWCNESLKPSRDYGVLSSAKNALTDNALAEAPLVQLAYRTQHRARLPGERRPLNY